MCDLPESVPQIELNRDLARLSALSTVAATRSLLWCSPWSIIPFDQPSCGAISPALFLLQPEKHYWTSPHQHQQCLGRRAISTSPSSPHGHAQQPVTQSALTQTLQTSRCDRMHRPHSFRRHSLVSLQTPSASRSLLLSSPASCNPQVPPTKLSALPTLV
jgi:hypothetical protein